MEKEMKIPLTSSAAVKASVPVDVLKTQVQFPLEASSTDSMTKTDTSTSVRITIWPPAEISFPFFDQRNSRGGLPEIAVQAALAFCPTITLLGKLKG